MQSDIFDFKEIMQRDDFGVKRYKYGAYKGQIHEQTGKRDGYGVFINNDGRVFEGYWLNDKRNGIGYETYKNGNFYQGTFMNNKPHGKGVYTWANGEKYDGEWV